MECKSNNKPLKGGKNNIKVKTRSRTWNALSEHMPERSMPRVDNEVYRIVQTTLQVNSLVTSVSVPSAQSYTFSLSALDQSTQLAAIFDQYRIVKIEFWLIPQVPSAVNLGELATVVDYDDAVALTTFAQAEDYQNCQVGRICEGHFRVFKPHIAVAAYSGTFTSYANKADQWIDCTSTGVLHYGVKAISTVSASATGFDTMVRYHVEFRNVR